MGNESFRSKGKSKPSVATPTTPSKARPTASTLVSRGKSASRNAKSAQSKSAPPPNSRVRTPIGIILLKRGMVKKFQLDFMVKLQKAYRLVDRNQPLGELLLLHRALSPLHLKEALLIQETMPGESVTQVLSQIDEFSQKLTRFFQVKRKLEPVR